mgnify:FL=1
MNGDSILLVEDDKEIRQGVEIFLRSQGYQVFQAENGLEGLKLLEERPIDLAIVDVMMPVMDGYEAARAIRSSGRADAQSIPIIALTANAFLEDAERVKREGMNEHLPKPLDVGKMLSVLAKYRK